MLTVPDHLRTSRLLLRRWTADDAVQLGPILHANVAHLGPWIPQRVARPASESELMERLAAASTAFDQTREWRYGIFRRDSGVLLGEVGLYPRNASSRVPFEQADRIEVGYWLRADVTGNGFATEAVRAVLDLALRLPHLSHVEIRCDERNERSVAIPQRLDFQLASVVSSPSLQPDEPPVRLQIWEYKRP